MAKKTAKASAPKTVKDEKSGYQTSDWNGHTNYHCPHCAFATLDLDGPRGLKAHVAGRHPDTTAAE